MHLRLAKNIFFKFDLLNFARQSAFDPIDEMFHSLNDPHQIASAASSMEHTSGSILLNFVTKACLIQSTRCSVVHTTNTMLPQSCSHALFKVNPSFEMF